MDTQPPQASAMRPLTRLKLAGLSIVGLAFVSIPVTIALVLSATGASDVVSLGDEAPARPHATPADAVADMRCTPDRGSYALTFDSGPVPGTTARLVATLRRSRAVATFFDIGRNAAAHPSLVEAQRSVGQVANHSYSHPRLTELGSARRIEELRATARTLDHPNAFVRPPYGLTNAQVDADIRRTGLTPVYWTVHTRDTQRTTDAIVAAALTVEPGGVVLLHEGVEQTIAAVPRIVSALRDRGMCPGFLAHTRETLIAPNGRTFNVKAVRP
jgi:peptidoglycan/xylan/chitin deacetylase (PgdA/CDA1 family)